SVADVVSATGLLLWLRRLLPPAAASVLGRVRLLAALGPLGRNAVGGFPGEPLRLLWSPSRFAAIGPRRRLLRLWWRRPRDFARRRGRGARTRHAVGALGIGVGAPCTVVGPLRVVVGTPRAAVGPLRVVLGASRAVVGALRAFVRALRMALAWSRRRVRRLRGSELPRLGRTLPLDLAVPERGPRGHRSRGRRLRRGHDPGRRRRDSIGRPRSLVARSLVAPS